MPRKAAHCLRKEVGQNIKDKQSDKRFRDGDHHGKGDLKDEKFPNTRKPLALVGLGEVFESWRAT